MAKKIGSINFYSSSAIVAIVALLLSGSDHVHLNSQSVQALNLPTNIVITTKDIYFI